MPTKGLEEEGLPKIPDLHLVQLKFLLTADDNLGIDKKEVWTELEKAITENGIIHIHPLSLFFSWSLLMCELTDQWIGWNHV